jgi:hypothetical protein
VNLFGQPIQHPQGGGRNLFGKSSPSHCGYGFAFPKSFRSNSLRHPSHFNFGFRVKFLVEIGSYKFSEMPYTNRPSA